MNIEGEGFFRQTEMGSCGATTGGHVIDAEGREHFKKEVNVGKASVRLNRMRTRNWRLDMTFRKLMLLLSEAASMRW